MTEQPKGNETNKELLAFFRSYSRVVDDCSNSIFDHNFVINGCSCGSCGLTYITKRRMKKIKELLDN